MNAPPFRRSSSESGLNDMTYIHEEVDIVGHLPLDRMVAEVLRTGYTGLINLDRLGPNVERDGYPNSISRASAG